MKLYRDELVIAEDGLGFYAHEKKMISESLDASLVNVEIDAMRMVARKYVNEIFESGDYDRIDTFEAFGGVPLDPTKNPDTDGKAPLIELKEYDKKINMLEEYVRDLVVEPLSYYTNEDAKKDGTRADILLEKVSNAFKYEIVSNYNKNQSIVRKKNLEKEKIMDMTFKSMAWVHDEYKELIDKI